MADVLQQTYSGLVRTGITCETKVYQVSQNITNNTSLCRVVVTFKCTNGQSYHLNNDGVIRIRVAGVQVLYATGLTGFDFRNSTSKEIYNATATITHNTDGTFSQTFQTECTYSTYADGTSSGIVEFDTIPRGSVIGTISTFNLEDSFSVPITKYSAGFTDTLVIKYGATTIKTISNYTNESSIILADSEIFTAYNAIDKSGTFTFQTTTFNGGASVGTDSKTATGTVAGTAYIKVSGIWKRTIPYIKVNGVWKKAIANIKSGGSWKRGVI